MAWICFLLQTPGCATTAESIKPVEASLMQAAPIVIKIRSALLNLKDLIM